MSKISEATQYMVAVEADRYGLAYHSVGVDSSAGLYVIDDTGRELNFSPEVQEAIYEALGDYFDHRVSLEDPPF